MSLKHRLIYDHFAVFTLQLAYRVTSVLLPWNYAFDIQFMFFYMIIIQDKCIIKKHANVFIIIATRLKIRIQTEPNLVRLP